MSQVDSNGTNHDSKEGELSDDLAIHLQKFSVSDRVYSLLKEDNVTTKELITFTVKDLEDWCNEHHLKTVDRRRFINAIKALPNSESHKESINGSRIGSPISSPLLSPRSQAMQFVFVGNEEKEQMTKLNEMTRNGSKLMENIKNINEKGRQSMNDVIGEINQVCDQVQEYVEQLRKNLLNEVYFVICVLFYNYQNTIFFVTFTISLY